MPEHSTSLRVDLLGPVRARLAGEEIDLGSAQRRTVFAVLAMRVGEIVSRAELIDAIWGENAPPRAMGALYTHISALRRTLGLRSTTPLLTSSDAGYRLRVNETDVLDVGAQLERARRHRARGNALSERAELAAALELLRGEPLAGLSGPFAEAQRARLGELRLSTVERHAAVAVDLGASEELVTELRALVAEFPFREGLQELLITALTRAGRQAEALAAFDAARETMIDGTGTEPGPALLRLGEELRGSATRPVLTRPPVFVGRRGELATLRTAVAQVARGAGGCVWVEGDPGIGKSVLLAEGLAEGLAEAADRCRMGWGVGDELSQRVPLAVVTEGLGASAAGSVDQVVALVRESCLASPLVLVIDNAQWADDATLLVLRHLTRATASLPLLLVVATRPAPHREELERLRAEMAEPLVLGPLTEDEVRELRAEGVLEAGGNPSYLHEPVGPVVERHLDALSSATREMVRMVALLEATCTAEEIAAAGAGQVAEALAAGVLAETAGRFRFKYPVVRRVLRDSVPAAIRVTLHRRIAQRLAAAGAPPERVAAQLVAGRVPVDDWTCEWLITHLPALADQAPRTAVDVLSYLNSQPSVPGVLRDSLATAVGTLLGSTAVSC